MLCCRCQVVRHAHPRSVHRFRWCRCRWCMGEVTYHHTRQKQNCSVTLVGRVGISAKTVSCPLVLDEDPGTHRLASGGPPPQRGPLTARTNTGRLEEPAPVLYHRDGQNARGLRLNADVPKNTARVRSHCPRAPPSAMPQCGYPALWLARRNGLLPMPDDVDDAPSVAERGDVTHGVFHLC
jgi:hypothetical protein